MTATTIPLIGATLTINSEEPVYLAEKTTCPTVVIAVQVVRLDVRLGPSSHVSQIANGLGFWRIVEGYAGIEHCRVPK